MIGFTNAGGGFDHLAMKVVGSWDAPANPKTGTVWVQTSYPISAWAGNIYAPGDGWTKQDGILYLQYAPYYGSGYDYLELLKYRSTEIYRSFVTRLIGATQCIGDQWVKLNGWIWNGSMWVNFSLTQNYLFSANNLYADVTGGWLSRSGNGTIAAVAAAEQLAVWGYPGTTPRLSPNNLIDFSNYNTLRLSGSVLIEDNTGQVVPTLAVDIGSTRDSGSNGLNIGGKVATKTFSNGVYTNGTFTDVTMDISGVSGSYYISFSGVTISKNSAIVLNSVVLE